MTKMRVYEYAKKNSLASKEVIQKLKELNIDISNHMSTISSDIITKLDETFKKQSSSSNNENKHEKKLNAAESTKNKEKKKTSQKPNKQEKKEKRKPKKKKQDSKKNLTTKN